MEKRLFSRAPFEATGVIVHGGERTEVEVENISLKGASVVGPASIIAAAKDGESVLFEIRLARSTITIRTQADVVRADAVLTDLPGTEPGTLRVGLHFTSIDLDSMIHLRRLLEFNSESADKIGEEMSQLRRDSEGRG